MNVKTASSSIYTFRNGSSYYFKKIGELVLFPAVRKAETADLIAAAGTSCRHQIKDGTGKLAKHPIEVLYEALV